MIIRWFLTILVLINSALLIFPARALLKRDADLWHTSGQVTITIINQTDSTVLVTPIGKSDWRIVPLQFYSATGSTEILPQRARFPIPPGQTRELIYNWWDWQARWIVVESERRIGQLPTHQEEKAMTVTVASLDDLQPPDAKVAEAYQRALTPYRVAPPSPLLTWLPAITFLPLLIYTLGLWSRAANPKQVQNPAGFRAS
jgi:hypothetical protein